jgi:hypothetical protein
MTNGRVEVITSVERRRRWSFAEKQQLVATTLEPGASVSAVAREAEISSKSALWLAAADARVGTDRFYADADCGRGSVSWFCRPWDDRDRVRGGSTDADLWQVDPATLTAVRAICSGDGSTLVGLSHLQLPRIAAASLALASRAAFRPTSAQVRVS